MWLYYHDAILRSFHTAIDWALAQGIALSAALSVSAVVWTVTFTGVRALRRKHSWLNAKDEANIALKNFGVGFAASALLSILLIFAIFFIRDAPLREANLRKTLDSFQEEIENLRSQAEVIGNKGIYIECDDELLPRVWPAEGHLDIVEVKEPNDGVTFQDNRISGLPLSAIDPEKVAMSGLRCIVTNYSPNIFIDVRIYIDIAYYKNNNNKYKAVFCSELVDFSSARITKQKKDAFGGGGVL
jgi:hypothetical protein